MLSLSYFPLFFLSLFTPVETDISSGGTPEYADLHFWAAHPDKVDMADSLPNGSFKNVQEEAQVDVFFLHPTTYIGRKVNKSMNADLFHEKTNRKTDRSTILYQASLFNGVGQVYAPRYRQAHLSAYYMKDRQKAKAALNMAYEDVKAAFLHYLREENRGRPIIIAGHSQGTQHAARLLRDFFDGQDLQTQLVAAYLIGMPVTENDFQFIPLCSKPDQTGCFCSWRTYKKGHEPRFHMEENHLAVTNPLSFDSSQPTVRADQNEGAIVKPYDKVRAALVGAEVNNGLLWVEKPKFPGSFLILTKNYHIADYNLFWVNVRNNAALRADAFLTLLREE